MLLRRIAGAITLAILMFPLFVQEASAEPPALSLEVPSAILVDYASGQVLYEQNADQVFAPASLTKLMTLHLAYKALAEGKIHLDDRVTISQNAWAQNPELSDSSLMFLEPGMNVTVREIMQGVAIPSGNDASIAMAEYLAGSVSAFVAMMNEEAKTLGFKTMTFHDPHGLSASSAVTAREMAEFARFYIRSHPESLADLHSKMEYAFPHWENLPPARQQAIGSKDAFQPTVQYNRNWLLESFADTDGLKTGFVDEAGYHLVATAQRNGMRLIGVVLGAESEPHREEQGIALMTWGFRNWALAKPEAAWERITPIRVWKGAVDQVTVVPQDVVEFVLPATDQDSLDFEVELESQVIAPVEKGTKLGTLTYTAGGKTVFKTDLVAADEVEPGGFFKRIWDSLRLWIAGLMAKK